MPTSSTSRGLLLAAIGLAGCALLYAAGPPVQPPTPEPAPGPTPVPATATSVAKQVRKLVPYLLFALLGLAAVTGPLWFQPVVDALYHAHAAAGLAASSSEIAAGQQAGGWVPSGTVASKFITAAGALILMVVLIWRLQNLTHPAPSQWAKTAYSADWQVLTPVEKFEAYGRIRLQYVLLAIGAMVFAALVV